MLQEEFLLLDDLVAPNKYVAPSSPEDLAYIVSFRQICKQHNIDFVSADQDKRDFVMHLVEEDLAQRQVSAKQTSDTQSAIQVVQSLIGAIPSIDLPLHKLRDERLKKYETTY